MTSRKLPEQPRSIVKLLRVSRAVSITLAGYAIVGGLVTLSGWAFDIRRLTDWNSDDVSMFANTAAGVVLGGIALVLIAVYGGSGNRALLIARGLGIGLSLVGVLTTIEHLANVDLGIDTLLFNRDWGQRASSAPMRMGLPAATSFMMIGVSFALATWNGSPRKIAASLALGVVGIVSLSLIGYWYGADQLYLIPRYTGIAWQSSTMIMSLGLGLIAAIPEYGIVAILSRDDAGGTIARRLMVPIVGLPLLLGWLRILGQDDGLYDMAFGTAVRTLFEIMLFGGLLWWTADGISRQAQIARAAEKAAKDADRRKDEFLATLAHELRNPLAPIGNALAIIKHADNDPHALALARDSMERQFGQMVRLVDDLLDIGRITRDKLDLRPQRLELSSIIYQSVEISRTLIEAGGHELRVDLPPTPIWVQADPVRLAQVFSNLLNNASKFTEAGGIITVSAERRGPEVAVTVSDTGIGIAPEQLERIFEMFSQVDQSLERTRSGLGIGLTLVRRLVELHGGHIDARSRGLGHGSEFIVFLPVLNDEPLPSVAPTKNADPIDGAAPRRILVTDDNQDAAKSLSMLLRLSGHDVETAYDGESAVEKADSYRPEVMLLDIGLPGMNGYDVCRAIRQMPWGKSIRIVALTGWGQEQDRQNAREAGFDEHMVKPVDPQMLRRAVSGKTS